ncbi:MAG: 30S ribosomal protein S15 [Phycisphaerae bacterium]|nr:30S ribosomal protein S15 [Phycisphaerae bacterium]
MPIAAPRKAQLVKDYRTHDQDSGSAEVQIALLTERINEVAGHLKGHLKDHHSRRGLLMMVGKRNRLLRYLARTDPQGYKALIGRLSLRK